MTDTPTQPSKESDASSVTLDLACSATAEVVLIDLPLSVDAVGAISAGIATVWPDAVADMSGKYPANKLAIVLQGRKLNDYLEDDDL